MYDSILVCPSKVMNSLKSGVTTPLNQLVSEIATLDVTELRGVEEEEGSESG